MKKKIFIYIFILLCVFTLSGCALSNGKLVIDDLKINYTYDATNLKVGDIIILSTNVKNIASEEDAKVTWTSSNKEVATISDDGLLSALGVGETSITAKFDNLTQTLKVVVSSNEEKEYILISGNQNVIVSKSISLTAKIYPLTYEQDIIWTTSDEKIATVDELGVVKGVGIGITYIKATSKSDSSLYKEILILVKSGDNEVDVHYNYIYTYTYNYVYNNPESGLDIKDLNDTIVSVIEKVSLSTIGVTNCQYVNYAGGRQELKEAGYGTGGIIKKETVEGGFKYLAFTNYHVIEDGDVIKAFFGKYDKEFTAEVVKENSSLDLALITFECEYDLEVLEFGIEDNIKTGDFVIAIGNPEGYDYFGSATLGIVSAVERKMSDETSIFVQHDAAINPGNSGGPLFDLNGKVIGINTKKLASTEIDNMGFSISLLTINPFLNEYYESIK